MNTLWLDMDGVLVNFVAGAAALHRQDPESVRSWDFIESWGLTASDFWTPMGYDFWVNLPPTQEAHQIVDLCCAAIGSGEVGILSSPCDTPGCQDGKKAWVKKHFPQFKRRVFLGHAKEMLAHPRTLLVDDSDMNTFSFAVRGGRVCLFPRPWNKNRDEVDPLGYLKRSLREFAAS